MKPGLLVAGAVLVTAAIVYVWRPRSTTTIAGLLAVLAELADLNDQLRAR